MGPRHRLTHFRQPEQVKVRIRPRTPGPAPTMPNAELLWAFPTDAHDGGGAYVLNNLAFFYPLSVGDLVRAELDGYSVLQITEVTDLQDGTFALIMCPREFTEEQIRDTAAHLRRAGCRLMERASISFSTLWPDSHSRADLVAIVAAAPHDGVEALFWTKEERRADLQEVLDFTPDPAVPDRVDTDYFAAEDPVWKVLGCDSPDHLTIIQRFVHSEPGVLASIRKGNHDKVADYIAAVMKWDPADPYPADCPELDDPWPGMR